jgi:hypothetical protein
MKIIISENQFKRLINENFVLYGATFKVNNDGTVSVSTDDRTTIIRFSKYYMDINVADISKTSDGGCIVKSKNGVEKTLSKENVTSVIGFARSSKTEGSAGGVDMKKL